MLPLDPKRVAELQRRLAARSLREEEFQILPDLLAWFRSAGAVAERRGPDGGASASPAVGQHARSGGSGAG